MERRTPIHAAAFRGEAEIVDFLAQSGARVNTKDSRWLTPLHRAVASKSLVSHLQLNFYNVATHWSNE